jgi:hypothetical protein
MRYCFALFALVLGFGFFSTAFGDEPATTQSSASMGKYVGEKDGTTFKLDLKDDQIAILSSSMAMGDQPKMETKWEGKWVLDGDTVTLQMTTKDGQPVADDEPKKKFKLTVSEHGDKLSGGDMPDLMRK